MHRMILQIEQSRSQYPRDGIRVVPVGEIDLLEIDPTDADVPHVLAGRIAEMLSTFYAQQRAELAVGDDL